MNPLRYTPTDEAIMPHAADLHERAVAENGFAAGWCMHAKPVADYWFDFHLHGNPKAGDDLNETMQPDFDAVKHLNVKRGMLLIQAHDAAWQGDPINMFGTSLPFEDVVVATKNLVREGIFTWAIWPHYTNPNADMIRAAYHAGARCVKIHNAPVIQNAAPADLWLEKPWQDVFRAAAECNMPIIWHVTQRLPSSKYTGGDANSYWRKGWENGVTYGNEELLQTFLRCLELNPDVNFVGAHQLHIGWERLDSLFEKYPNLYVDTTIGCMLQAWDTFYPADKQYLRQVFIKWADRLLYGTDNFWGVGTDERHQLEHMRFIQHLDLPEAALNKIAYQNAERLLSMKTLV
ncbi:MAG: amidohydrolase family protein [Defluviitaleaceae bacterium]|nr:amidohydrolase family protein [Defluviitaleaceae bacterium]